MIKMTVNINLAKNSEFKIDLFDLEDSRFYVKLDANLVDKIRSNIELNNKSIISFSNKFKIPYQTFYGWLCKKEFPLSIIKLFKKEFNISEDKIKQNLIHIRSGFYPCNSGGNLSNPISPKFPIKPSKELIRIIAHLFGDGNLSVNKKGHFNVAYYNQNKFLMKQFIEDVGSIFNIKKDNVKINKTTPYILLPSPIGRILLTKIKEFNSKKCRISSFIKKANQFLKIEFLKSFFDDEAYVRYAPPHRYIEVALSNKSFIKDLKEMLSELEISTSKMYHRKMRGFDVYYFNIKSYDHLNMYYKKIGFNNPDKQKQLKKIIENPGRKSYLHGQTKEAILRLMKEKRLLSSQLARKLNRKLCTINHFLRLLENENKIKCIGKKNKYKFYKVI